MEDAFWHCSMLFSFECWTDKEDGRSPHRRQARVAEFVAGMSFNPLVILHERQCSAIYNALDAGRPASAVKQCDELLAKQPDLYLATALKSVGLCRTGNKAEANRIVDQLIKLKSDALNSSVLSPLSMALSMLDRDEDEADVLDMVSKAQPGSVDMARKACMAMARTRQWQRMQQTALRIHKTVSGKKDADDLYFWWSMQAYCLVADDPALPGSQLALPLAQRMIVKQLETKPLGAQSDEALYLYGRILQKQGKAAWPEAIRLLSEDRVGKALCERSMTLAALRHELQESLEEWDTINAEAVQALGRGIRNWSAVEAAVKSAIALTDKSKKPTALKSLEEKLMIFAREDKRDRTTRLAPIFLLQEANKHGKQSALTINLLKLLSTYIDDFSSKACAFEDIEPALQFVSMQERDTLLQKLSEQGRPPSSPFTTLDGLYKAMNAVKLQRALQNKDELTAASETHFALQCMRLYLSALPIGKSLPKTEMQPSDDFALLAAQALIHASALQRAGREEGWRASLQLVCAILHVALTHSPKGYRPRILLIRVLLQFGAIDAARVQFDALGVKGIQYETLGWVLAGRFAHSTVMLPPGSEQERDLLSSMRRMRSVWHEARTQVPAMVCKALEHGTFSRVEEMLDFASRLDNSIARRLHAVEAARLNAMGISAGLDGEQVRGELVETCKALKKGQLFDQRDRRVLLNLLPPTVDGIAKLTSVTPLGEPDETYLRIHLALSAAALNVSGAEEAEMATPALHQLASEDEELYEMAQLLRKGGENTTQALQEWFERITRRCKEASSGICTLPCAWLHSSCAALEAFYLVQSAEKIEQKAKGVVLERLRDVQAVLKATLDESQRRSPSRFQTDQEWTNVLQQALLDDRVGETLLQERAKELDDGTKSATEAILARIKLAIN